MKFTISTRSPSCTKWCSGVWLGSTGYSVPLVRLFGSTSSAISGSASSGSVSPCQFTAAAAAAAAAASALAWSPSLGRDIRAGDHTKSYQWPNHAITISSHSCEGHPALHPREKERETERERYMYLEIYGRVL